MILRRAIAFGSTAIVLGSGMALLTGVLHAQ